MEVVQIAGECDFRLRSTVCSRVDEGVG